MATLAVFSGMAAGLSPASADHGGDHFTESFFVDVHLATPAVTPIPHVCVDDDGDGPNEATCTPSSIESIALADFRVAIDVTARTAAPPEASPIECRAESPNGGGLQVEALGTGIDNARVRVINLQDGTVVSEHETGKVLGNRVTVGAFICTQ